MNRGYIKIWRKIEDSGLLGNAEVCQLFLFLMVKATYRPRKIIVGGNVMELEPGEYFAGRKQLALELNSTEQKIRTALSTLEKCEIINQRSTSRGTVIKLINWRKYQDEQPAANQHFNQELTTCQPAANQQLTTKQEVKNISKRQEEKSTTTQGSTENEGCARDSEPPSGGVSEKPPSSPPDFRGEPGIEFLELREYYDQHGRGEGKQAGFSEYKQLRASRQWPGQDVIYRGIDRLDAEDGEWQRGFAPGLARFLRERIWEKEPVPPKARDAPGNGGAPRTAYQQQRQHQAELAKATRKALEVLHHGEGTSHQGGNRQTLRQLPAPADPG